MFVLCFHIVKFSNVPHFFPIPFFSFLGLYKEKITQRKPSKSPSHRDPIITRFRAKMSTNGPSPIEENTYEINLLKEQMVEMMRMMQQLVVGGGRDSSSPILEGPAP